MRRVLAVLMTLSLFAGAEARADWPAGGKKVAFPFDSVNGTGTVLIFELPSGDLAVLATGVGGNSNGYNLQRIDRYGTIAPGWPADGTSYGTLGKTIRTYELGVTVDDSACVWKTTWVFPSGPTAKTGGHLITPDGVLVPASNGVLGPSIGWLYSSPATNLAPSALAPAPGGVYAFWSNRVQRMLRGGTLAPGWPAAGRALPFSPFDVAALEDGAAGVVVLSTQVLGDGLPKVLRIDASSAVHAGWASGGLALTNSAADGIPDISDAPQGPKLIHSDATHMIAAWSGPYDNPNVRRVRLQRFSLDGTLDPAWPADGVLAAGPDSITGVTVLPDRSGGAYVLWYDRLNMARGTHVRVDGQFEPGTSAAGTPLPPPSAAYEPPWAPTLLTRLPYVPADVTPDGRLIYAWNDTALNPTTSIRVRWLLPDLSADPSEPANGRLILPAANGHFVRAVHADELGGAFVAWEVIVVPVDVDCGQVWMTRLLPSSLVSAPPAHAPATLALSAPRPNPARGSVALDVTLPDDSPARVELLDVAGRVVRTQLVQGAGPHAISIRDLATLSTGLYFARVTHPRGSATSRVVVTR